MVGNRNAIFVRFGRFLYQWVVVEHGLSSAGSTLALTQIKQPANAVS
jgi:hypothetical protein